MRLDFPRYGTKSAAGFIAGVVLAAKGDGVVSTLVTASAPFIDTVAFASGVRFDCLGETIERVVVAAGGSVIGALWVLALARSLAAYSEVIAPDQRVNAPPVLLFPP
jgi:hypothetical protein